ncbi:Hypothetical predicted protein [Octopus vulgaris]|nr:Hypothetical predicted protein [Octopus vulgaris]
MSALRHQVEAIRDSRGPQQQQQQPQQQQHPQQPQRSLPSPLQAATHPLPSSTSLSAASSSSSASSLSSSSSSSLSSSSSHQLSQHHHHHHQTPVNNTNNMRASCNVVAANASTNLNNASAKQNNVDREVQSQVQLSTSNMVGACAGASCLPSGVSHSTYNYIASNSSSNAGLQSKDNRAAFGGMKKGFLENMTNNSRDGSSNVGSGGGAGGSSGGIASSNSSSNSSSNNSGATGSGGASGGCNNKRSNETKNLIDCNQIGSKKTYNKDMPFIKPKNTDVRSSSFELHEELENIREKQTLLNSTEWVTDALLTRLQSNPNLIGRLSDPTFIEAITDFQKNPQSAMAKYQGDKDLQASMQEFCSILGDHLLKLDKKDGTHKPCNLAAATPLQDVAAPSSSSSTSSGEAASSSASLNHLSSAYMDNEHRMQDLLTDPEIREALVDKKVQEVIAMQSQNPERAQSMLHQGDAELRKKVRKLVDAGLLTFNS